MDTAGIFHSAETPSGYTSLWDVTWERIDCFLPNLKSEVFKPPTPGNANKPICLRCFLFESKFELFYSLSYNSNVCLQNKQTHLLRKQSMVKSLLDFGWMEVCIINLFYFHSEPKKQELIAPKAPEVPRECARPSTPQNVPYSSSPPKSQLISALLHHHFNAKLFFQACNTQVYRCVVAVQNLRGGRSV